MSTNDVRPNTVSDFRTPSTVNVSISDFNKSTLLDDTHELPRPQTAPNREHEAVHEIERPHTSERTKSQKNKNGNRKKDNKIWRNPYKPPAKHCLPWDDRFVLARPLRLVPIHRDPVDVSYKGLPLLPMTAPAARPKTSSGFKTIQNHRNNGNDNPSFTTSQLESSPTDATRHNDQPSSPFSSAQIRPHTTPSNLTTSVTDFSSGNNGIDLSHQHHTSASPVDNSTYQEPVVGHGQGNSLFAPKSPMSSTILSNKKSSGTSLKSIARQQARLSILSKIRGVASTKGSALKVLNYDLRAESVWKTLIDELRQLGSLIRYEDIYFIGALKAPHRAILALMGFIATIIGIEPKWEPIKKLIEGKMLIMRNFLHEIKPLALHPKKLKNAVQYWDTECIGLVEIEAVSSICIPATHLARWAHHFQVIAHIIVYADTKKVVSSNSPPTLPVITQSLGSTASPSPLFGSSLITSRSAWTKPSPTETAQDRLEKIRCVINEYVDKVLFPVIENNIDGSLSSSPSAMIRWDLEEDTPVVEPNNSIPETSSQPILYEEDGWSSSKHLDE